MPGPQHGTQHGMHPTAQHRQQLAQQAALMQQRGQLQQRPQLQVSDSRLFFILHMSVEDPCELCRGI